MRDPPLEHPRVELEPDEEEVEDEPDVGRADEERHDERREEVVLHRRRDPAEQRRAEQDAGEHLAHDRGLADLFHQRPDEARGEHHCRDRKHQASEDHFVPWRIGGLRRGARLRQRLQEPRRGGHAPRQRPQPVLVGDAHAEAPLAAAEARDLPREPPMLEPELSVQRAARIDELARLLELELPRAADARAGAAVGAATSGCACPVGAKRERGHGEAALTRRRRGTPR